MTALRIARDKDAATIILADLCSLAAACLRNGMAVGNPVCKGMVQSHAEDREARCAVRNKACPGSIPTSRHCGRFVLAKHASGADAQDSNSTCAGCIQNSALRLASLDASKLKACRNQLFCIHLCSNQASLLRPVLAPFLWWLAHLAALS